MAFRRGARPLTTVWHAEELAQRGAAWAPSVALKLLPELALARESAVFRFGHEPLERFLVERWGCIEDRAGWACQLQAVPATDVATLERAANNCDPRTVVTGADWDSDADVSRGAVRKELPQGRRRPVAQDRARPTGEQRRRFACVRRWRGVAGQVNAAVHPVKAPVGQPAVDRAPSDASGDQLRPCDHPVLAGRQTGNDRVGGGFATHTGVNPPRADGAPGRGGAKGGRGGRWRSDIGL